MEGARVRNHKYTKKITLKDGTVKEYNYERNYTTTTNRVTYGKNEMRKKITDCKDKAKLERLKAFMEELGM